MFGANYFASNYFAQDYSGVITPVAPQPISTTVSAYIMTYVYDVIGY